MTETVIDTAYAAMDAAPQDDTARLRFYDALASAELFLMLTQEPVGDSISPEVFELQDASFVLVFDREDRISQFAGRAVPYAALPGRALAQMLSGQNIGLALNPEVAPSEFLMPPEALEWLSGTLDHGPEEREARPEHLSPPRGLPDTLITALDTKLASAAGLARTAYLAAVTYDDGSQGHLLGVTGSVPEAQRALAGAVNEALVFSGLEAGVLDVTFVDDSDILAAELARVALRFDLPEPPQPKKVEQVTPGSDPDSPPILK
ncbi:SseB family protein [uncultured Pelagimonas sp.]|uniref:SseB family protein n=1 Tax=uncultured Pelagimonas sp. TaxID=1618102 RepID=UPI002619ABC0|nr:SseB family protein [uncultured Pelagimonas sp.]